MSDSRFKIRGHHLSVYSELASWRSDPYDLSRSIVEGRKRNRKGSAEAREYSEDVIGTTKSDADIVESRYRAVFFRFMGLDRDDPIVITTGEKDHICESCIIGNHCSARGPEMSVDSDYGKLQVYATDVEDMFSISKFKKLAGKLALRNELDPALGSYEVAYVPEPSPHANPLPKSNMIEFEAPIQAPAGYVRAVLAHWTLAQSLRDF